jgi:hypothetical protein
MSDELSVEMLERYSSGRERESRIEGSFDILGRLGEKEASSKITGRIPS